MCLCWRPDQQSRCLSAQVALSTDLISGFCTETEQDHKATLNLVRSTGYDQAFMFAYSQRERTAAARHLPVRLCSVA